jgi:hypothetical protein
MSMTNHQRQREAWESELPGSIVPDCDSTAHPFHKIKAEQREEQSIAE